jgi:type I restriction enzyme S subunit
VILPPLVALDQVLTPARDEVALEPDRTYRTAGIYSFARGAFERQPIRGGDTSYTFLVRLHKDDFVVSRLNGWEGAMDVVSEELDGCLVSSEYPVFHINRDNALPNYMRWVARWPAFWDKLVPRGSMVRRKRVNVQQLLGVAIPLPTLDAQSRIAAHLDRVRALAEPAAAAQLRAERLDVAALDASVWRVLEQGIASGWPMASLSQVAQVNPPRDRLEDSAIVRFVPMAAVDALAGRIGHTEERRAGEMRSGYKQFRHGDVIFARITPCMQNGKIAVFDTEGHAYGSTEFHVLRPGPDVHACWVHRILRTRRFREYAKARMTGTAGQQRVPAPAHRGAQNTVPPMSIQLDVVARIDRLLSTGERLHERRGHARMLATSLLPAVVNEAFGQFR